MYAIILEIKIDSNTLIAAPQLLCGESQTIVPLILRAENETHQVTEITLQKDACSLVEQAAKSLQ